MPGAFTGSDGVGIWRIMQGFFADVTDGVHASEAIRRATGLLAAAAQRGRWPMSGGASSASWSSSTTSGRPTRPGVPGGGATSALLLPAAVLLGGLVLWPVLRTMHASVTTDGRWVGDAHFRTALAARAPARWSAGRSSGHCWCRRW
ncbi:hypothetical protein NKG94_13060 [Micromonospora sp. M12]